MSQQEPERLQYLLTRFKANECTKVELDELNEWFRSIQIGSESMASWLAEYESETEFADASFERFSQKLPVRTSAINWKTAMGIAASLLIIVACALLLQKDETAPVIPKYVKSKEVRRAKPGNHAIITLANGKQINLDGNANGALAREAEAHITKIASGKIAYNNSATGLSSVPVYNTLTTPRGGKYELVLADGTEVTLDAASSITYPVAFSGPERVVEVKGQAYFKVIHNDKQPFLVKAKGQLLRDIGTEFNVNAYDDEPVMHTTLVEGSISISNQVNSNILTPGLQAIVRNGNQAITVQRAEMDDVLAWTKGSFSFHHQQITDILRQAARWYDIDISYEGPRPHKTFGGTLNRDKDVTELLENMKIIGGIRYRIEGRRVIIMN